MNVGHSLFEEIISIENLLLAWQEFRRGKRSKPDVQEFERNLEDNLFQLRYELQSGTYRHGPYRRFTIHDPKYRIIHKASVRDRIVHHAIFHVLYPPFDCSFIFDSYSCQIGKGTHRAVARLGKFLKNVSRNFHKPCWALKCDIARFFDSLDHETLKGLLSRRITDRKLLKLLSEIIESFPDPVDKTARERDTGLPIGNLISQLFANIYLNELDQFIKHGLRIKYYIRYTDDFIIAHQDRNILVNLIPMIGVFLEEGLKLRLHPKKIILRSFTQGVDFLGYVVRPYYSVMRTRTRKRMFKKIAVKVVEYESGQISRKKLNQSLQSYYGILKHCHGREIKKEIMRRLPKL